MPATCYQAGNISKLLVSLAIQLSTHRGVKRAKNAISETRKAGKGQCTVFAIQ